MRTLSLPALQALMAQDTAEVFVPLLKIEHASLVSPILLAYNTEPVVRTEGTYLPYPFQINLPDDDDSETPEVSLTVSNTDLEVSNAILALVGQPDITFMVVLASSPNTTEAGPFPMKLATASITTDAITSTLGQEQDIFTQQVPGRSYLPSNSPGMFL